MHTPFELHITIRPSKWSILLGIAVLTAPTAWRQLAAAQNGQADSEAAAEIAGGDRLLDQKKFDEAVDAYSEAIRLTPENAQAYAKRGFAFRRLGEHQRAIADYTRALTLDPDDAETLNRRGWVHYLERRYEQALSDFKSSRMADPAFVKPRMNIARLYRAHLEKPQAAIAEYDEVIRMDGRNVSALNGRGLCYLSLRDFDKARLDFKACLTIQSDYSLAHYNLGRLAVYQQNWMAAIQRFNSALKYSPEYKYAFRFRALAHGRSGNTNAAAADLKKALEIDPDYVDALMMMGGLYSDLLNQPGKAVPFFDRILKLNARHSGAWFNRGVAFGKLDRHADAISDFDRYLQLSPGQANGHSSRGLAYAGLGKTEKALSDYLHAEKLGDRSGGLQYELGRMNLYLRRYRPAIEYFSRSLSRGIGHLKPAAIHAIRGQANFGLGLVEDDEELIERAEVDFRNAVRGGEREITILRAKATEYRNNALLAAAVAQLTLALKTDPSAWWLYTDRARVHVLDRDFKAAVSDIASALERAPDTEDTTHERLMRATSYFMLRRYDESRRDFEEFHRQSRDANRRLPQTALTEVYRLWFYSCRASGKDDLAAQVIIAGRKRSIAVVEVLNRELRMPFDGDPFVGTGNRKINHEWLMKNDAYYQFNELQFQRSEDARYEQTSPR